MKVADSAGQSSVEFVALAPLLAVICLLAVQFGLAGLTKWSVAVSARSAARAEAVGSDPLTAAKKASVFGSKLIIVKQDGEAVVKQQIPRVLPIGLSQVSETFRLEN